MVYNFKRLDSFNRTIITKESSGQVTYAVEHVTYLQTQAKKKKKVRKTYQRNEKNNEIKSD